MNRHIIGLLQIRKRIARLTSIVMTSAVANLTPGHILSNIRFCGIGMQGRSVAGGSLIRLHFNDLTIRQIVKVIFT